VLSSILGSFAASKDVVSFATTKKPVLFFSSRERSIRSLGEQGPEDRSKEAA